MAKGDGRLFCHDIGGLCRGGLCPDLAVVYSIQHPLCIVSKCIDSQANNI